MTVQIGPEYAPLNKNTIEVAIEALQADVTAVPDPKIKTLVSGLLNVVETLYGENEALKEENQQFKDEINRLKGEQGKPEIKAKCKKESVDHSSEKERQADGNPGADEKNNPKKRQREGKLPKVKINREQVCLIDKNVLPADAQFKGYSDVVIQDIKIVTDNVKYRREVYYSPSQRKTFLGQLPVDVAGKGEFGVGVRALIPLLKSECNLSESCILDFFQNFGIEISSAYISNQWTKGYTDFHQEKSEIVEAGLASTTYQQIDDTSARVNGENHYTHIICNAFCSVYFTTPHKDRLTVLDVFRNFAPRQFLYNAQAINLLKGFQLSNKIRQAVDQRLDKGACFDEGTLNALLDTLKPGPQLDERISKTRAKREALLLVLDYPELPLHNNASELAARVQARERDVSLHTLSQAGTKAKDTFMTISQTAKKLGVKTYDYIRDRVSGEHKLPSLAQLIREKSSGCEAMNEAMP